MESEVTRRLKHRIKKYIDYTTCGVYTFKQCAINGIVYDKNCNLSTNLDCKFAFDTYLCYICSRLVFLK